MNTVVLVGRLTKDPITHASTVTKFAIAVDRRIKREGEPTADFFNVVAFGKTAEFIQNYFHKGYPISITGRIQTGSYTKADGTRVYTTDIVAESAEFVPGKPQNQQPQGDPEEVNEGFAPLAGSESYLPF